MTSSDGFYITLPADGSVDVYPDNNLSHFTNRLVQPVDLSEGEWEVGLMEMMFPTALDNITREEAWFDLLICQGAIFESNIQNPNINFLNRYQMTEVFEGQFHMLKQTIDDTTPELLVPWGKSDWNPKDASTFDHETFKIYRIHFRPGPYPDPESLVKEVNEGIKQCMYRIWDKLGGVERDETKMELAYDRNTKKMRYFHHGTSFLKEHPYAVRFAESMEEHPYAVRFAESMGYKMGFGQDAILPADFIQRDLEGWRPYPGLTPVRHTRWLNVNYETPNTEDLYNNLHEKYVYCDSIESQLVGGDALKLLKVVSLPPQRNVQGAGGRWDPMKIQYMKLAKKYFDTIEIDIRTPLGQTFPFNSGKVVVVLHFRRLY